MLYFIITDHVPANDLTQVQVPARVKICPLGNFFKVKRTSVFAWREPAS